MTLDMALRTNPLKEMYETEPETRRLIDTAKALEGMPRHASTHAAGVVITEKAVYECLDFVGLDVDVLQKSPFELSGGQKRRVAIAGVLAMNPSVIILDEPTAGLDPIGRNDLLARLKDLHKSKNVTIIIVSHSMEEIASVAEKIIVMSEGEVLAFDSTENIFANSEMLIDIGLGIPQITLLYKTLRESGIPLPDESVYSVEQAADIIFNYIKGDKNA